MESYLSELDSIIEQQRSHSQQDSQPQQQVPQQPWTQSPSFTNQQQQQQQQQQQTDPAAFFNELPPQALPGQHPSLFMPTNVDPAIPYGFMPPGMSLPQQHHHQQQQHQQTIPISCSINSNSQPVKIRKKPGRKPNPASPALRKAQNRAAQRAFRERKERHLRDLETTIRTMREQRATMSKELKQLKTDLDGCKVENWYLRGIVLTLQFVCLHHNIQIPYHAPYLSESALSEMARTSPHAIEAYVNAYMKNNAELKTTVSTHVTNGNHYATEEEHHQEGQEEEEEDALRRTERGDSVFSDNKTTDEVPALYVNDDAFAPGSVSPQHPTQYGDSDSAMAEANEAEVKVEGSADTAEQWLSFAEKMAEEKKKGESASSLAAIQRLRIQLRVQSTLSQFGQLPSVRLQPTLLQLAVPHDPRIDLIPTAHMRDRMIIFRDIMDYDRCFNMLLNGATYHGGDPTLAESWELPADFFSEYWYLAINYDYSKTNQWRIQKGLPEVRGGMQEAVHSDPSEHSSWTDDDVFKQFMEPIPELQPLPTRRPGPEQSRQQEQPDSASRSDIYQSAASPGGQPQLQSPGIDAMLDLMNSLSTDIPH
ncbi:hypothetical protein BCR43DRAFT_465715 [Syncephalastrum racemosum]|uniref:BZIP domain-containing protein n=1 Tax=Syncephalastrum racemosum TaxID=13706 RepID=A0A1X2HSM4_SYNRA|nr:hypothetical protein BCR43DRAFT_465715 [Syncephalastrum racemosum]